MTPSNPFALLSTFEVIGSKQRFWVIFMIIIFCRKEIKNACWGFLLVCLVLPNENEMVSYLMKTMVTVKAAI